MRRSALAGLLAVAVVLPALAAPETAQPVETSIWKVEVEPDEGGKYKVRGSIFAIGDPVHEVLTLRALIDAGLVPGATLRTDLAVAQFIRGAFWNDDPCAQLFEENDFTPLSPSMGVVWYVDFLNARRAAMAGSGFDALNCELLGRSHFGDLQFLHGMADGNGIPAGTTAARLLAWASVAYRVAVGDIGHDEPLQRDATARGLLGSASALSARRLFRAKSAAETRARALGSLLHMIQDAFARGHATRADGAGGQDGAIEQFLSYADQNEKKHAHDDAWRDGSGELERTLAIPGAREALRVSIEVVRLFRAGAAWDDVQRYLDQGPLKLAAVTRLSGPGPFR